MENNYGSCPTSRHAEESDKEIEAEEKACFHVFSSYRRKGNEVAKCIHCGCELTEEQLLTLYNEEQKKYILTANCDNHEQTV